MSRAASFAFSVFAVGVVLLRSSSVGAPPSVQEEQEIGTLQSRKLIEDINWQHEAMHKFAVLEETSRMQAEELDRLKQEVLYLAEKQCEEPLRVRPTEAISRRRRRDAEATTEGTTGGDIAAAADDEDPGEEYPTANGVTNEGTSIPMKRDALQRRLDALEAIVRKTTARSCEQLRKEGAKQSGLHYIDPDGVDIGYPPIQVHCEFDESNEIAETYLSHEFMEKTVDVSKCSAPGCSRHEVTYSVPQEQINALIEISTTCSQGITYDCYMAPFSPWATHMQNAWWVGRDGSRKFYWSGPGDVKDHVCACGVAGNCTAEPTLPCNCDAGAPEWFQDNGTLTDKESLPIQSLHFGGLRYPMQQARFTLGPLRCSGVNNAVLTRFDSCRAMKIVGHRAPGYYFLDSPSPVIKHKTEQKTAEMNDGNKHSQMRSEGSLQPTGRVAKCNFNLEPHHRGFEETILEIKPAVVFNAYRNTSARNTQENNACCDLLDFDGLEVNLGGGMQGTSGVFVAPAAGNYLISFVARRDPHDGISDGCFGAQIYREGVAVAQSRSEYRSQYYGSTRPSDDSLTITTILRLEVGDNVTVGFEGGLQSGPERSVQFMGYLLDTK